MDIPAQVALFPLPDHVLLPGLPAPFRVFEPRYRALVADLAEVEPGQRWLAMPRLAPGWQDDYAGSPAYLPVAALALVRELRPLPGGEALIMVEGLVRCRLAAALSPHPYRLAAISVLADEADADPGRLAAAVSALVRAVTARTRRGVRTAAWLDRLAAAQEPLAALALLGAALLTGADQRQSFLECLQPAQRCALLHDLVARAGQEGGRGLRPSEN